METSGQKPPFEGVWAGDVVETVHGRGTVSSVEGERCWVELPELSLRWQMPVAKARVIQRNPETRRKQRIKKIVEDRGIPFLVHFTRTANLPGILEFGLVPRARLDPIREHGCLALITDETRFDLCPEALSLSIGFPNYRMFYKYRSNLQGIWAVIKIDPAILWEKECAFCLENAASSRVRGIPIEVRRKPESLRALFRDYHGPEMLIRREDLGLPDHFPTHPQAEVLVFDTIEAMWITEICLETPDHLKTLEIINANCGRSIPILAERDFYRPRKDYKFWREPLRQTSEEEMIPF